AADGVLGTGGEVADSGKQRIGVESRGYGDPTVSLGQLVVLGGSIPRPRRDQTNPPVSASDRRVTCGYLPQQSCATRRLPRVRVWAFVLAAACALGQLCFPESPAQLQSDSSADVPQTAPFTAEMLSSYNGQMVASVEVAGQPNRKT